MLRGWESVERDGLLSDTKRDTRFVVSAFPRDGAAGTFFRFPRSIFGS